MTLTEDERNRILWEAKREATWVALWEANRRSVPDSKWIVVRIDGDTRTLVRFGKRGCIACGQKTARTFCADHNEPKIANRISARVSQLRRKVGNVTLNPEVAELGLDGSRPLQLIEFKVCAAPGCDLGFYGPTNKACCSAKCRKRREREKTRRNGRVSPTI